MIHVVVVITPKAVKNAITSSDATKAEAAFKKQTSGRVIWYRGGGPTLDKFLEVDHDATKAYERNEKAARDAAAASAAAAAEEARVEEISARGSSALKDAVRAGGTPEEIASAVAAAMVAPEKSSCDANGEESGDASVVSQSPDSESSESTTEDDPEDEQEDDPGK